MKGRCKLLPAKLSTVFLSRSAHVSVKVASEVKPFSLFNLIYVLNKAIKGTISGRCETLCLRQWKVFPYFHLYRNYLSPTPMDFVG